jgi:cytochrome c-type biogenesis protein CcmH
VAQLEARLQRQPEDAEGWSRLGQARLMMGEPKQARTAFEEALKRKPNDVDLLVDHATAVLDDEGTTGPIPPAADAIFRKVLALAPENLDALWYVGVAELQAGRADVARVYWERLLGKLDAGSAEAKQVQEAIGNLKQR